MSDQIVPQRSGHARTCLAVNQPPARAMSSWFETEDNPSGFEWWSGTGPPYKITAGSVATVDIIVERVRPITLVIPALRKLLSIEG